MIAMAWVYALSLLVLGFVLVLLEIFVIPGFNIFGILGFLTVCGGVAYAYTKLGMVPAVAVAGIGIVGTAVLIRLLVRARAWRRLVLESRQSREGGYTAAEPGREVLVGRRGEAVTPLRPAGRARFGDKVVDVVSEGGFIGPGSMIEVLRVAGSRVVVHPVAEAATEPNET